ncbi:MAG: UDP-N-acetylmuramoyl-tripeptide--D-alanyl-D-alanine ligase [Betaproteobacteria bacterium]
MMRISQAARALGAQYSGDDAEFCAVCTDSRAVKPGDLFVALKGERYDAHAFLAKAGAAGAAGLLVEQPSDVDLPQIVVDDTTRALGRLGNYWRRQFDIPLIAVTGSNGKTTVKEMLASILRQVVNADTRGEDSAAGVLATRGNLNNHIGVPLTLLELRREHRYAVIEMGMNHAGEISYITRMAEPSVAVINNAGVAHMENLGSAEAIARAKGEIFEGLKPGGTAVINADDPYAPLWRAAAAHARQLDFALEAQAAVTATYEIRELASEIVLKTPLGTAQAVVPAPGLHNVRNALAASAAATALEVPPAAVAAGLAHFGGSKRRLERKRGPHGATLIDDTYNANPDSMRAAITVLARAPGKKLLVIGDMGELGPDAVAMHAQVGEFARAAGIGTLFTLGEFSAHATRAFGAGARHFERIEDLLAEIKNLLAPDVTMLVKGSRFMQMERVIRAFEIAGSAAFAGVN